MKKAVSAILAVVMTVMCLFSTVGVSAAGDNAVLNKNVLTEMIGVLGENMPDTVGKRTEVYNILETYLSTDANIESLILTVENLPDDLSTISDATLRNLAVKLDDKLAASGKHLSDYQSQMLLMLDLLASLPAADRLAATNAVRAKNSPNMTGSDAAALATWRANDELKITEDADFQAALQNVYAIFFNEAAQIQMAQNGMGANAMASLSCAFDNSLKLTDDEVGGNGFAVLSYSDAFVANLATNVGKHFSTINGQAVTGEKVLNAFVEALNGFSAAEKANIKTVLDNSAIDLYESLLGATLTKASIVEMVNFLNDNMPESVARRLEVYNVFKTYLSTDANLEALISTLYNLPEDLTTISDANLKDIAVNLNAKLAAKGTSLKAYRSKLLLMLDLLACLPASDRVDAVEAFEALKTTGMSGTDAAALEAWTEDVEEKLTTDSSFQTALQALYNEFVSEAAQIKLAQSGIGANAIAALSAAFDGNLYLTDNTVGGKNFAVKSSDDDFVDNLGTKLSRHFASLNGNEITGEKVLAAFIDALNDFSSTDKTNIKTVLDHDKVDLYTPLEAATQRPSSGSSSSGKKNNSSSSSKSDPIRVQIVTYATPEPPAEAAPENLYDDTIDHWGKDYVGALTASGVLTGYGDGTFMPNMGVTREEIAVILTRALGLETAASVAATTNFTDRSYISEWAIDAVNVMVRRGVFEGYDDGSFKPQQVISREEMVAVIIRTFSNEIGRSALTYTDADTVSEWAREYLEKATGLSLVEGYPDGSFRPRQTITRAEAAKVMYNYMHYAGLNK